MNGPVAPPKANDLLAQAIDVIERASHHILGERASLDPKSSTDMMSLNGIEQELVRKAEDLAYRKSPVISAVDFCLQSSISLLAVAHSLTDRSRQGTPVEREQDWKKLATDTKLAGRAAYRAALILFDPAAEIVRGAPAAAFAVLGKDKQLVSIGAKSMLGKAKFESCWQLVSAAGVTASEFIEFLRPLAEQEGVMLSYCYCDEDGTSQTYRHLQGSADENPVTRAIRRGELTREKALSLALSDEGRRWIAAQFDRQAPVDCAGAIDAGATRACDTPGPSQPPEHQKSRILIVEDESVVALVLQHTLARLGYDVVGTAGSSAEAMSLAQGEHPDVVLMDINLGLGGDGVETAARMTHERPTAVIYLTAYSEEATSTKAHGTGPYGYLRKPFSEQELQATIQTAIERHRCDADDAKPVACA